MSGPVDILTEAAHGVAYEAVRSLLKPIVQSRVLIRAEAIEHVPATGPALLVSNHRSVLDPLVIGAVLTRHVHFVAARWMGQVPGLSAVLRSMGILILPPAAREWGLTNMGRSQLQAGALMCIFPEGAWPTLGPPPRGQAAPFHHGAARIILDGGIPELPVVPTGIIPGPERVTFRLPGTLLERLDPTDPLGKRDSMNFMTYDTVTVRFGAPLAFVPPEGMGGERLDGERRAHAADFITRRLHDEVEALLGP